MEEEEVNLVEGEGEETAVAEATGEGDGLVEVADIAHPGAQRREHSREAIARERRDRLGPRARPQCDGVDHMCVQPGWQRVAMEGVATPFSATAAVDPDRLTIQYFEHGGADPQKDDIAIVRLVVSWWAMERVGEPGRGGRER